MSAAVVIGSGPNGLAAAITMARAGRSVQVIEGYPTVGGGTRSLELTLPGYLHDICSAIHPMGAASPFFRSLPLSQYGLEWIHPPTPLAHPLENGVVFVHRSIQDTAAGLGSDACAYTKLMAPMLKDWEKIIAQFLAPFHLPPHPVTMGRFLLQVTRPWITLARASKFASSVFKEETSRAVFAGMAAHSMLPLDRPVTAGFGVIMSLLAHAVGFPLARGGSQKISDALAAYFRALGGQIQTGRWISSLADLPPAQSYLFDVAPRQLNQIAADRLPSGYRRGLDRFRYGVGVFKIDFALDGPIPWKALEVACSATVHVGGTAAEIAAAEAAVWKGEHPDRPFIILAQQSLFDPSRAPQGKQTAWAYCHVPNGSTRDMTPEIIGQIERFAPGFQKRILDVSTHNSLEMEAYNPNYIGGDINGGVQDLLQFFTRPLPRWDPYSTPAKNIFLCSSSTPPGGGVHGMCGYYAARSALRHTRAVPNPQ